LTTLKIVTFLDIVILLENIEFKNIKMNSFETGNVMAVGTSILLNGYNAIVTLKSKYKLFICKNIS
jgi:hypothetical protein